MKSVNGTIVELLYNNDRCKKLNTSEYFTSSFVGLLNTSNLYFLLNIGLELDTRNVEQTKDVRMYIEEFILVEIWIHWS